jgi:hypothetical protein
VKDWLFVLKAAEAGVRDWVFVLKAAEAGVKEALPGLKLAFTLNWVGGAGI